MADLPSPDEHVAQAIADKKEHIENAQAPRLERINSRREAYQRIVDATKHGMEHYYTQYPERAVDERSREAETWSINGLSAIFDILDDYYITKRMENENGKQQPNAAADQNAGNIKPSTPDH